MERKLGVGGLQSENQLYDAAARGDERSLQELLEQDPLLLNRVSYTCSNKTPLHVATIHGHLPFVQAILAINPDLAQELDSHKSSALHVASSKGYLEIARELLSAAPDMCLSRDFQGRNPLHLAAMKGHVGVLEELVRLAPASAACEKLDRGVIVLHLCVKYGQLEALKVLVEKLNDEIVNEKDDDGDTVMHVAVRERRIEIIRYLADNTNIDVNAKNSKGQTSLSILDQITSPSNPTTQEITKILTPKLSTAATAQPVKWLTKKRDSIMVVAILIATMAFQAGVSPPGGVWQEDSSSHKAGEAIMAHNHPKAYKSFIRSNTVAFVSSLSTILLLISGLPFRRRLFMWVLMVIMWLTVTSTAVTYAICIVVVTPTKDDNRGSLRHVIEIALAVWCGVMGILLVGNTVRLVNKWLKNRGVFVWRPKRFRNFVHQINRGGETTVSV